MTKDRAINFNPGPAVLPEPILEKARENLLNFERTGMSVMEISHRSKEFTGLMEKTEASLRRILGISDDYAVLFLQGGASLQFAMVPMNLFLLEKPVDVIHTGYWTQKAIVELQKLTEYRVVGTSAEAGFKKIPARGEIQLNDDASYLHITSNNTIYGTQWPTYPSIKDVPLVADMTSDFLSRKIDVSKFGVIFAGAQKNLGPAGLTVVILRKDLADRVEPNVPTILQYKTHIKSKSLYNTPPTFPLYMSSLFLDWMEDQGGLDALEKKNERNAKSVYDFIDGSDFYQGPVEKESRSKMSVVIRIRNGNEELETKFVKESQEQGLVGLKGHRAAGGLRASLYNAQPLTGVQALIEFMRDFEKANG